MHYVHTISYHCVTCISQGFMSWGKIQHWDAVLQREGGMTDKDYSQLHALVAKDLCANFHTVHQDGTTAELEPHAFDDLDNHYVGMRSLFTSIQRRAGNSTMQTASPGTMQKLAVEMQRIPWPKDKMPENFPAWCSLHFLPPLPTNHLSLSGHWMNLCGKEGIFERRVIWMDFKSNRVLLRVAQEHHLQECIPPLPVCVAAIVVHYAWELPLYLLPYDNHKQKIAMRKKHNGLARTKKAAKALRLAVRIMGFLTVPKCYIIIVGTLVVRRRIFHSDRQVVYRLRLTVLRFLSSLFSSLYSIYIRTSFLT